jgi:hypothetical protein
VIEASDPAQNIILALENLEENNKDLKSKIESNNKKLDGIRKLLGGL